MLFRQVQKHGDNFSYVIADEAVGDAVVVDPSFNAGELIRILQKERLALRFIINTHGHSDHTAGNAELRSMFAGAKTVVHRLSRVPADLLVDDGDMLYVGAVPVKVIHTPGHTPDSICLLVDGKKLLTGDTLFVGECGRTDLPGGNARSMYDSLFNKLLRLDDDVEVYPGHDYGVRPSSTIGEERRSNYTLQPRSIEEFVEFMRTP
ncbi:MAG: MBL fold metallo-hydrolase [Candidatus Bathyarchaeia archaeon]